MSVTRVVGIGSPFGDDQLGWRVADLLQKNPALQIYLANKLDVQLSDRPGLTLLNEMRNTHTLYVIDAVKTKNKQVGRIHRMNDQLLSAESGFLSTHGFGLKQAIDLAKALQCLPHKTIIYGIEINEIDYQESISQPIEMVCQDLAQKIAQELLIILNGRVTHA